MMGAGIRATECDELSSLKLVVKKNPIVEKDDDGIWRFKFSNSLTSKIQISYASPDRRDIVDFWGSIRTGELLCPWPLILSDNEEHYRKITDSDLFVLLNVKLSQSDYIFWTLPATGGELKLLKFHLPRKWILDFLMSM